MAVTNFTPLLGLALPTTGDLSGTWGTTVNAAITDLLDDAVAGTVTLSADADVTLSTTNGADNQARNAVILWTASNGATTRNITAPAQSKAYIVINAGTGSVVIRGAGPTTGVTVTSGTKVLVAWNGSDFVKVTSDAVTTVSVVSANGFAGTVANPTSTPAITLTTSITGVLKANGTAISAAVAGTDYVTPTGTETLTNKRITPRVNSSASTTSPWAWNSDSYDQQEFTALANALTINADAGTPTDGQKTIFRFQDDGTARALTWTTGTSKSFRAIGVTLPTTTVINKTVYIGCVYNSGDARWDAVAVSQET